MTLSPQIATALVALLIWIASGLFTHSTATAVTLRASTWSRALRPGEVILVTVESSHPLTRLKGTAFARSTTFWTSQDPKWYGLVPIPLETRAGNYSIALEGRAVDETIVKERVPLKITRATFATRRLRVNPRFVNPPVSAAPRIRREGQKLAAVFAASQPQRLWRGDFAMPVPGEATSSFGRLSILNGRSRGRHQGADFNADEGTPVRAPNAGKVVLAADHYFSGKTVVLDHGGGLFSLFAHLSRIAPADGADVERGELLGEAGSTGRATGPHLHWTLRLNDTNVDPLSLITALAKLRE